MKITNRWNGATIFESEAQTMLETLIAACGVDADLCGADLCGAKNLPRIPVVENLDARILEAIGDGKCSLDMKDWHTCETTHCRAGWAIHLAGESGYVMESFVGPKTAGALIYHASTENIPDFFASTEAALDDIKKCAAK